jgi:hypothetical protein
MPPLVLRIMQDIDALIPPYNVPQTMPDPLMRDRKTRHGLQLKAPLESLETARLTRSGL